MLIGPEPSRRYPLDRETRIGRAPHCQIQLSDERTAPEHAKITWPEHGEFTLYDIGGPITVNHQPLLEPRVLEFRDEIAIGACAFVFYPDLAVELAVEDTLDPLTRAFSKSHTLRQLALQVVRAGNIERPLSLIAIDLDQMRHINEQHGYRGGERALIAMAAAASTALRPSDLIGRTAGTELCVIAPGLDHDGARQLAEQLRAAVAAARVVDEGTPIFITASLGVATLAPDDDADALLARARACVVRAKHAGRDAVASDP